MTKFKIAKTAGKAAWATLTDAEKMAANYGMTPLRAFTAAGYDLNTADADETRGFALGLAAARETVFWNDMGKEAA